MPESEPRAPLLPSALVAVVVGVGVGILVWLFLAVVSRLVGWLWNDCIGWLATYLPAVTLPDVLGDILAASAPSSSTTTDLVSSVEAKRATEAAVVEIGGRRDPASTLSALTGAAATDNTPVSLAVFLPPCICGLGGLVIGLLQKRWGPWPPELAQTLADVQHNGDFPHDGATARITVASLVTLLFGGSVGPEAGISGMIAGLATKAERTLKRRGKRQGATGGILTSMALSATLTTMYFAPVFGLIAPFDNEPDQRYAFPRYQQIALYLCALFGALAVLELLVSLFGGGLGLPRFSSFDWKTEYLLWLVPLVAFGILLGYLYHLSNTFVAFLGKRFGAYPIAKAVCCGVLLGCIGILLPSAMFDGESQLATIQGHWQDIGASVLLATGAAKLFTGPLCIQSGWRGGRIFPTAFAGMCCGYGIALLTGIDATLCVALIMGGLFGMVFRKPLNALGLLFLCFPPTAVALVGLAVAVGSVVPIPHTIRLRKPPPTKGVSS